MALPRAGPSLQVTEPSGTTTTEGLTVNELVLGYLRFAETRYVKNGRRAGEARNLEDAFNPLMLTRPMPFSKRC